LGDRVGRSQSEGSRSERLAALLRRTALFSGLSDADARTVAAALRLLRVKRGALVVGQGDPGDAAFFVYSGHVDAVISTEDGRELIVNQIGPGEVFGEMALLEDSTRSASIVAQEDCELFTLRRDDFMRVLQERPALTLALLRTLSNRLRRMTDNLGDFAFRSVPGRLAKVLLDLDEQGGHGRAIVITQDHLAGLVGTARQTATLILNEWRRAGIVELARRRVTVLDRRALSARAGGEADR